MHTVSSPRLLEDAKNIDPVLKTEGWETLMTFTRESARKYSSDDQKVLDLLIGFNFPASRPTTSAPSGPSDRMIDDDIPPEVFDQIAAEEAASRGAAGGSGSGGGGGGGIRICPHCTFENVHRGTDCEVCGLPLA